MVNNISSKSMPSSPEEIVVFDESSKRRILTSLGIREDKISSELVNDENKKITNKDLETVKFEEFGGVLRSSKRIIKKDKAELVRYFIEREE